MNVKRPVCLLWGAGLVGQARNCVQDWSYTLGLHNRLVGIRLRDVAALSARRRGLTVGNYNHSIFVNPTRKKRNVTQRKHHA